MEGLKRPIPADLFEKKVKKALVVDPRYSVLYFKPAERYLNIITDSLSSAMQISKMYQELNPHFRIKIVLLPDRSVGDLRKGVCHVGIAPVRRSAASSSEQMTQVLLGETFETLRVERGWVLVRLHADGYIGWVSEDQVTLMDDKRFYDFHLLPDVHAVENAVPILEKPSRESAAIRETVYGTSLRFTGRRRGFLSVRLPDGPTGWVRKSSTGDLLHNVKFSVSNLIDTARRFLGVSYEWGGRSPRGFDCSGFVQAVFRLNGVNIPRDTDVQFLAGKKLGKSTNELRAGDLLFFSSNGDKINHVGIYTGKNKEFIHSSGFVRINSLDKGRRNFSRKLSSTFVGACRVI